MTNQTSSIEYDNGGLFRVENIAIPGRELPYEFVHRIGAVTILPILTDEKGDSSVLTISNQRIHYGTIFETPGGNLDGGFDEPEDPGEAALRELQEEIGYQPANDAPMDVFRMREVSRSVLYPRFFAVARNLFQVGETLDSASEIITIVPTPIDEYIDTLLSFSRGEVFPEVTLALAKATQTHGRPALQDWLVNGAEQSDIPESFSPWLLQQSSTA